MDSPKSTKKKMKVLQSPKSKNMQKPTKRKIVEGEVKSEVGQKKKKTSKLNQTWEDAVDKARGAPDGAIGGESMLDAKSPEHKQKAKKKPLKVIQSAAGKLKKWGTKGTKRKREDEKEEGGEKKPKIEELSVKERKKQRRSMKNNYSLSNRAKAIWEEVRKHNVTDERRQELCAELYLLIKDKAKELIMAHDTSRVVQCLVKYGLPEHKEALFEELRENIVELTKSKYAKFFVRKLLKYGTKSQRNYVFRSFNGNVRKLVRHKEASEIIEVAYNDYANASQRASMVEEFYGPSFTLFKTAETRTLHQIMESNPEKKETILGNMKESLAGLIDKEICQHSIVHRVFLEFFTYATPKLRSEMIEVVRESVIHMLHTRDGARVAMHCLWYGAAKDRKVVIKSFKTYVLKIAKEEHGHMVLLAMFDCVDDTKLVHKVILEELLKSTHEVAQDQYGRKVLLYLLSARDPLHFCPDIVKILQHGDGNTNSKKDSAVRRQELLQAVSPNLLTYVCQHTKEIIMNNALLLLLMAILTHADGDLTEAMKSVCKIAAEPFTAGSLETLHLVEHPAGHIAVKRIILNDTQRIKAGHTVLFSDILLSTVPTGGLKSWAACNRGCFTLITLLELDQPELVARVKNELAGVKSSLTKLNFKGAQILLSKL